MTNAFSSAVRDIVPPYGLEMRTHNELTRRKRDVLGSPRLGSVSIPSEDDSHKSSLLRRRTWILAPHRALAADLFDNMRFWNNLVWSSSEARFVAGGPLL